MRVCLSGKECEHLYAVNDARLCHAIRKCDAAKTKIRTDSNNSNNSNTYTYVQLIAAEPKKKTTKTCHCIGAHTDV